MPRDHSEVLKWWWRKISTVSLEGGNQSVAILEVEKKANKDDVKRAYFKLAKQYHPDINKEPSAKEKFAEINEYVDIYLTHIA